MNLISEKLKIDIALAPQNVGGGGAVAGTYYPMNKYGKALFVAEIGAMAAGATSILQVMQATDAAGGGPAKAVDNLTATITANSAVTEATVADGGAANGATVTINGIAFKKAAGTDATKREFSNADGLVTCVNDSAKGVPGVTATNAAGTVTLSVDEPGEGTITLATSDAANITLATVRALGYVECDASFLDIRNGFDHVAISIDNSAQMQTGAVLLRGDARYTPTQFVAASKTDTSA